MAVQSSKRGRADLNFTVEEVEVAMTSFCKDVAAAWPNQACIDMIKIVECKPGDGKDHLDNELSQYPCCPQLSVRDSEFPFC